MKKAISFLLAIACLLSSLMMLSSCEETLFLHCSSCNAANIATSTYCVNCGKPMYDDATDNDEEDSEMNSENLVLMASHRDGGMDLTHRMAAFIVWQNLYQIAYTDYLYTMYGLYEDTDGILSTYTSPDAYGLAMAQKETTEHLHDGIDTLSAYLAELVAGADMAIAMGLTQDKNDEASVNQVVDFMKNLHAKHNATGIFNVFQF